MSLDYEFTPIDVSITTHPKAFSAGVEAMGLWLWAMAFAKEHRTEGRAHRAAVLGAWGGRRNIVLAKRLVAAGLWIAREDGDWDIHNFEKKGPGSIPASSGATRQARYRETKRRNAPGDADRDAGDVTRNVTRDVTRVTSASVSVSSSVSSGSDQGGAGGTPPEWFIAALAMADQAGCPVAPADVPARWVQYQGSAANRRLAMTQAGAGSWLVSTIRGERSKAESERERGGGGPRGARQPHDQDWLARRTGTDGDL